MSACSTQPWSRAFVIGIDVRPCVGTVLKYVLLSHTVAYVQCVPTSERKRLFLAAYGLDGRVLAAALPANFSFQAGSFLPDFAVNLVFFQTSPSILFFLVSVTQIHFDAVFRRRFGVLIDRWHLNVFTGRCWCAGRVKEKCRSFSVCTRKLEVAYPREGALFSGCCTVPRERAGFQSHCCFACTWVCSCMT